MFVYKTALFFLILCVGCASTGPLVGTWELMDGADPETAAPVGVIKVVSDTHFAFGNSRVRAPSGTIAGGGEYTYADGKYTETIGYHWNPMFVDTSVVFECKLDGDLWFHYADFRAGGERYVIDEVWRRVGPPEE